MRLKGKQGPAWLEAEALVVTYLTTYLRVHMPDDQHEERFSAISDEVADDGFWSDKLAIITPHHAQRFALQHSLLWPSVFAHVMHAYSSVCVCMCVCMCMLYRRLKISSSLSKLWRRENEASKAQMRIQTVEKIQVLH